MFLQMNRLHKVNLRARLQSCISMFLPHEQIGISNSKRMKLQHMKSDSTNNNQHIHIHIYIHIFDGIINKWRNLIKSGSFSWSGLARVFANGPRYRVRGSSLTMVVEADNYLDVYRNSCPWRWRCGIHLPFSPWKNMGIYPLVNIQKAIENGHL